MFAQFHESYITKSEAEMYNKKRQHRKKPSGFNHKKRDPHHNKEQHKQQMENIYEKRYFDYLPSEAETSQDNDAYLSHKIDPKYLENQQNKRHHSRKRRDLVPENNDENLQANKDVDKRQAHQFLASHYFLENERRGNNYINPQPQGYYYPVPNNPFVIPPSRHYLPVNPAYTYQLIPSYSYQIFPQNHISYNNPGTPPVNPRPHKPIHVIPQRPGNKKPNNQKPGVVVDDRFSFDDGTPTSFTDNDGRYIWGTKVDDTIYAPGN